MVRPPDGALSGRHGHIGLTSEDIYLHNTLVILTDSTSSPSADGLGAGAGGLADARLSDFGACAAVDAAELRRWRVEY